jgi:hypothetical protein
MVINVPNHLDNQFFCSELETFIMIEPRRFEFGLSTLILKIRKLSTAYERNQLNPKVTIIN